MGLKNILFVVISFIVAVVIVLIVNYSLNHIVPQPYHPTKQYCPPQTILTPQNNIVTLQQYCHRKFL